MDTIFEELFALPFNAVINIQNTDDDGIYHYIHIDTKDVYSFDTEDNVWLFKNDILQRLNIQ